MATLEVLIYEVKIEPHPNADRLEIATVEGYECITEKGLFKTGDLAAYIPEQSVVPADILEELGLTGRLAGSKKNRVKAIRLRGVFSQGILYPVDGKKLNLGKPKVGDSVAGALGITKYEVPIPISMRGAVKRVDSLVKYDIQNLKKYTKIFKEGEPVILTEKLHGTLCRITYRHGRVYVSSKGLGNRNLAFTEEGNNVYQRGVRRYADTLKKVNERITTGWKTADTLEYTIFAEVYGKGIQDLDYGSESLDMRVFDINVNDVFLTEGQVAVLLENLDLKYVPVVYRGPFSQEKIEKHTVGKTLMDGDHMREGVVIRPQEERRHKRFGRVILKSISADYLTRKGNTTEFD